MMVYAPSLGQVQLVVLRHEHGNAEYLVTNARTTDLSTLVRRKWSRWRIETLFRATKHAAGLAACQAWVDPALVRPVALVWVTFVVLQLLRHAPQQPVGAVKARWHGAVLRDGHVPPTPLRAAPPEFRPRSSVQADRVGPVNDRLARGAYRPASSATTGASASAKSAPKTK
jgi:hypothetical protein